MVTAAIAPFRIQLDTRLLNDALANNLVVGIQKVAPQSPLMKVPAIAASYAAIGTKSTALAGLVSAVAADEKQLKADTTARDQAHSALLLELVGLKSLVMSNATSAADVTGMGFTVLDFQKASQTRPDPPALLLVKTGKVHGKSRVVVGGVTRGTFAAQLSTDPITGTWTDLPGSGKQRKLSGYPSGTKLWVRFAQVRFGLQSDWSTPVLVTIP